MSDMQALDPDTEDWGALQLTTRWRSNLAPHLESGADNLLSAETVKRASTKKFLLLENTGHRSQYAGHSTQVTGRNTQVIVHRSQVNTGRLAITRTVIFHWSLAQLQPSSQPVMIGYAIRGQDAIK